MPVRPAVAAAGINKQINFQGKVTNGNGTNVVSGSYTFVFSLYSVAAAGSNIWTETKSLTVTDGVFQTNLGSVTSLPGAVDFNTDNIYLGINFNADGEMSPRIQFTAAAYAFNSDKLQGLGAAAFAQLAYGSAQSGTLNVTGVVQSATSLQAPLVDTATAVALGIGTGTASSVTLGRTTTPFLVQGNSTSTFAATNGANTTTVSFTTPTASRAINFPDAGGKLCTDTASTCSATYQVAGSYLAKNAVDSSSFAVTATNFLYGFTNSSAAVASGVLKLDNGSNTGSGLTVVGSGNPAAGQALILANGATGITGNLIDLQVNAVSKLAVDSTGNVTQTGGTSTTDTINGQRISSAANFTGTVTAATSLLAPLLATVDVAGGTSNGVTVRSGNATAGNGGTGNVTLDTGSKNGSGFNGNVYIGNTNALNVTIGHNGATAAGTAVSIQGLATTSSFILNDATNTFQTTIGFTTPTANRSILFPDAGGKLCTDTASTCSVTYQTAGSYLQKNASDASTATFVGNLYTFTNNSAGAAGALALINSGTNSALSVTSAGNPGTTQAVILATNTNGAPSGNLIDLRVTAGSRFSVDTAGAVTTSSTINAQTISSLANFTGTVTSANTITASSGGIAVTGTGTFNNAVNITGLTTTTGGITNNSAGIAAAGAISGASTVTASGVITGGGAFKSADTNSASANTSATSLKSGDALGATSNSGAVSIDSGSATGTTGAITVGGTSASAVTIGRAGAPTTIQGSGSLLIQANNGANYSTIQFASPTAQVAYTLGTNGSNTSAAICTSLAASCNTTYQPYSAGGYLAKSPGANEASTSNFTGYQYTFTQNTGTAAGNLSLVNSGTNSALLVTASSNPSAGQALIAVNNTNGAPSGNLLDLQKAGVSQFAVDFGGNVNTLVGGSTGKFNGQSISSTANFTGTVTSASNITVTSGGITVGGNSNITGTLGVSSTLTVSAGGASITGGVNNNAGGITAAGAVSGLTSLQYNTNGTLDTSAANSITIGGANATAITLGKNTATIPTLSLQGNVGSEFTATGVSGATKLTFAALASFGKIVQIPNESGIICTSAASSNANCTNYAPATLGTGYIQNQIAAQQSASNFWISATGRADISILTPLLDATTAGGSVAIGTTNATAGVNINQNTTLAGGKSLTLQGALTQSGGAISLAGNAASQIVTTAGNALTITSATAATWSTGAGVLTVQGFAGTTINSPNAAGAVTGGLTVQSGDVTSGAFASGSIGIDVGASTGTKGTISLGVTSASAISIGRTGITTTHNGTNQIGASAGTGALVNNGSTVNTTYAMANLATGGWDAGGAAATVDKYTYVSAVQTTAGQTLIIPSPTANTAYGRLLYLTNTGSASFTLLTTTIGAGSTATMIWANNTVGGAAWTFAGADGSGVLNQNSADQTANFRISGTGRANTSITTPLVDSISGGLNLGTATATGVTIGGTTNTTGITLQGTAGVTITIGNAAGSGVLTNNGATLNSTLALGNFVGGGSIGTAATTVDIYTSISIFQTTVNQTLTIPTPTANTNYGRLLYLSNVGTTGYNLGGVRIPPGNTATMVWSNTNGAASWQFAGAGATSIENQNTSNQAADFRISGSGQANTSFLTPALDVASAGTLSLGTTTATGVTIGNIANTTAITLQVTSTGIITLGGELTVNTLTNVIQIGSGTSNNGTSVLALNNNNGTSTPPEVDGGMYYNNSTSQFLCGENGFWVNCGVPPRDHSYDLYDEFMSGNSGSLVTGAYGIGGLNWYNSLIGAPGALTYNNNSVGGNAPAASADRPGIIDIRQTGTGNGTGQTMSLGLGSALLGTSRIDMKTAVNITGGNLTVLVGLDNETTANTAPTTGVYWKEASNGTWQYCYANATPAETCGNSAVTATAGTWARLEIIIVSSTEIDYYINGTKIAVTGITYNTTNMVAPAYTSWKSTGTPGTLDMYIDYFELLGTTSTAR